MYLVLLFYCILTVFGDTNYYYFKKHLDDSKLLAFAFPLHSLLLLFFNRPQQWQQFIFKEKD